MAKRVASENEARFARESRNKRIANCKECNGAPPKENFELQGVCGEHCGLCMEVINWKKVGEPIRVPKTIATQLIGNRENRLQIDTIPGVNFTDLKI